MMISARVRSKMLKIAGGFVAAVVVFVAATAGGTGAAAGVYVPDSVRLARAVVTTEEGGEVVSDSVVKHDAGSWLTDANVLALLGAINASQVAAADIELQAWHSDTVRALAASMAREHAEIGRSIDSVAAQMKLAPVVPAVVDALNAPMRASLDTLRSHRGLALDRAYVRHQITSHQSMAQQLAQLGAVAERPELQTLATTVSTRVAAQIERAKAVDADFVKADSIAAADSAAKAEARRARRTRGR
jgi:predicted outer membrane protein